MSEQTSLWAGPGGVQVSHLGYAVDDLESAVATWTQAFGAGPFFLLQGIEFDRLEYCGSPASWTHSAAFGQWGPIIVELQQIDHVEPAGLRDKLTSTGAVLNHIAYVVDDPDVESARLEGLGMPRFMVAKNGPAEMHWHEAPKLGHSIEVHKGSDYVRGFFDEVKSAAEGWDGRSPLRAL